MRSQNHNLKTTPSFPVARALGWLSLTLLVLAGAFYGVGGLINARDTVSTSVVVFVALVLWLSAVVSICPMRVLGSMGPSAVVWGYFAGTAARIILSVGACAWAIIKLGLPAQGVLLVLVGLYLPVLFLEAGYIGRHLWRMDRGGWSVPAQRGVA